MTKETKLSVSLALPGVPATQDCCIRRFTELLIAKEGIEDAHLVKPAPGEPGQICVHFDPHRLSVSQVREFAHRAGAEVDGRYGHLLLRSKPQHASRARTLSFTIEKTTGVIEAVVAPDGTIRVEFNRLQTDEDAVRSAIRKAGIRTTEPPQTRANTDDHAEHDHDEHAHGGVFGPNTELIFSGLSGVCLVCGWLLPLTTTGADSWIPFGLYLAAYFFGGAFMVREACEKFISGKFEIDFLMLVAAAGAAILGEWAEGALLLFLFSVGHALEHYAMGRAKRAIEALAELAPATALVNRDGDVVEVAVNELRVGNIVVVKPNERISADGFVVKGESSVNQAPITGESVPVDKQPGHRVFAGTINGNGALEIEVTKPSAENTLSRVVQMVSEAETRISPTQQFTDKFERYFVPTVLALIVLLHFAWLVVDESFSQSFYRAMAVLVAASPCALAIATPSAVLSGVARAARGGVLVKGGGPLESLGRLSAIAFDKTGTLTEGKPRLTDVVAADGVDTVGLLRIAVAVEALSDHPLAAAVVRDGRAQLGVTEPATATSLRSITGRGVQAEVDGKPVFIGKDDLFNEIDGPTIPDTVRKSIETLEQSGRTTMIVRHGDRYLGIIGLMDTPRESAKGVIAQLRQLGVKRMIMISGDNQKVAEAVASEVGLDEARGDLMPDEKVEAIKQLQAEGDVAMVGDGVNDAPAMANASVGIAMGAAGSDVALETADIALMADDLNHLTFAVGLSRQTSRIIRQNLWFSLGMVAFLIPATIFGLRMGPAVILHEGSTLLVVFNALRLLAYKRHFDTVD
ncbi:UNVERIFIED_CONTAM: hypothetical protein GTU68_053496 [Idotea baltica]|nr:hypothetical protein [Idotea baltica]